MSHVEEKAKAEAIAFAQGPLPSSRGSAGPRGWPL